MSNNLFVTNIPNFLQIQYSSFCWFLISGLSNELSFFPAILDSHSDVEVRFYTNEFIFKKKKDKTSLYCKQNNLTYGIKIFLPIYIKNKTTNQILRKKNVFIAELPLMTNNGSFIVNGCERVIVNQIIKCPGLFYRIEIFKDELIPTLTVSPQKGSWLKFELHNNGCWVRIAKSSPICILDFLYTIGLKDEEIIFGLKSEVILYKYKKIQEDIKYFEPHKFLLDEELKLICSSLFNIKYYEIGKIGRLLLNKRLNINISTHIKTLTHQDILAILDYFLQTQSFLPDNIDDLKTRRIRSIGEILENQFRIGLNRLERNIFETLKSWNEFILLPSNIVNHKPLIASIKEFFGSSQLSQYMDQTNPLAELSHKRRISAIGPGGLNAERVTLAARDINISQFGRICPIETPEGKNVGLVGALACYAKIDYNGFIQTPYFQVKKSKILYDKPLIYLTANEEENLKIASADVKRDKNGTVRILLHVP